MGLLHNVFGSRKQYNGAVDHILRNYFEIETDFAKNQRFCGILHYLRLIDGCWNAKLGVNETAAFIAGDYYEGILSNHAYSDPAEPRRLGERMLIFVKEGLKSKTFDPKRAERFLSLHAEISKKYS